ncbi:MAG: prenyltransferase/squalene oxidase repeat-containing protein [Methanomassiliicoccus sp.]|nr:prenyltransferase/squalene oxidase repeat-containing protein [Methanomassiliicoccus sp.]
MSRFGLMYDPLPWLLRSSNLAVRLRAAHELDGQPADYRSILEMPAVKRILRQQQGDGSWRYPGRRADEWMNYEYLETYRQLGELVEMYGLRSGHPAIARGTEFMFSLQTGEGDFRGIYGTEYSPNYTAGVLELMVRAGLEDDPRVGKGFDWLLSMRQDDGGWAVPLRTVGWKFYAPRPSGPGPVQPDRTKPSSHMVTGVVMRALAASERHRHRDDVQEAGYWLASRFFRPDRYPDRRAADYWTKFTYPFWFTDLASSLDALSAMGVPADHPPVAEAIEWFRSRQREDGSWRLTYLKNIGKDVDLWVHFGLCRSLKRYSV